MRFNEKCPEALAVECAGDIQITNRDCEKAIKNPTDITAELACIKDLMSDKKACWSCICEVSKKFAELKECQWLYHNNLVNQ